MSNNKDFKVKNGIQPTVYHEGLGTVVSGSEGYSIGSASYDSKSFSVAGQTTNPYGLRMSADGTRVIVLDRVDSNLVQYNLSTAYDITTAVAQGSEFSLSTQTTSPMGITVSNSGAKVYVSTETSPDNIYQYDLSTAWDVSTASYSGNLFSPQTQAASSSGIFVKEDGTKLYVRDITTDAVYQYTMSTPYDISTASYDSKSLSVSGQSSNGYGITFSVDGLRFYITDVNGNIYQYDLSTAWDISTGAYSSIFFSVTSQESTALGLEFSNSGQKMYIVGQGNDTIYQYSTVLTTAELDLSTGSVFDYTPTSDVQVTLTNPAASGTSSGATLLLGSEDSTGVSSTFSTTLWTGNNGSQTIANGIDLLNEGGLVWFKNRTTGNLEHKLVDTERGLVGGGSGPANAYYLQSDTTNAQGDRAWAWSFLENGFSFNKDYTDINATGENYVSWTFKKQTKFFDIVTYTGTASVQNISHNLGSVPGMIIVKRLDSSSFNWQIYHRNSNATPEDYRLEFTTGAAQLNTGVWGSTAPTDTHFTVGVNGDSNGSGAPLVAYLFAHDTDASSLIKCGSYTGNGSTDGPEINLGWEPQWVMLKQSDGISQWYLIDNMRGWSDTGQATLRAEASDAEGSADFVKPTPTGFKLYATGFNASGSSYIYMAIRNPFVPTITYDSALQWSGGTAPTAPAIGETDVVTFNTRDGGSTYQGVLAIDGAK
jgi:DNA-binding beta-propeller fold protein YncE